MKNRHLSCIFFILLSIQSLLGFDNNIASQYIHTPITINEGLPSNFIDDIYKDKKGFIWIATQGGGLARYDGYEFMIFNVRSKPLSLKSNFIRQTIEDNHERLWIVSNEGIDIINLKTLSNSNQSPDLKKLFESQPLNSINKLFKDSQGAIWMIGTDVVLKVVFDNDGKIKDIASFKSRNKQSSFSAINETDGKVHIVNGAKIYQASVNNSGEIALRLAYSIDSLLNPNTYISTILSHNNYIWVGTEYGILRINKSDKTIRQYTHSVANPKSLSHDIITDMNITNDNSLIVGTLDGLNIYNEQTDNFEPLISLNQKQLLGSNFINCILIDGNNLWIGSEAGGINKMTKRKLAVKNYIHSTQDKNSLSTNLVNTIFEDSRGNLWVGTVEGGLNLKTKDTDSFTHYTSNDGYLRHNSVSTIDEDRNGRLWIGTWGAGVSALNITGKTVSADKQLNNSSLNYTSIVKYDSTNNGIWICTNRDIFFYDLATETLYHPVVESITRNIMGTLGCIIDDRNILWVGTSKGLMQIDLKTLDKQTQTCKANFLVLENDDMNSWFLKNITCIYQAKDKSIWMGSNGYGLANLTFKEGKYTPTIYTTNQGIANDIIFGILEDKQGLIWASTGLGLSCYNKTTARFANYTKDDGLASDHYYWNASYKSPTNKHLYFGSIGGLVELNEKNQYPISKEQKVVFTKLQIYNNTVWYDGERHIDQDISYTNKLELHERDKSFSIWFSALDYDNPSTVMYSYRLVGFDNDWIEVDAGRRFINYTNLEPGDYKLQVRCMSKSYDWSSDITELQIIVRPFFFKTSWFILAVLILLIYLSIQLYQWRVSSLKRQGKTLHEKVEKRTQELHKQKIKLEEQANELRLQNKILFKQNEKISAQQSQLISMSKKVQEAMEDRIAFFTNITHEFRTPITLIIGPVERALRISQNPKVIEQLEFVVRNTKNLLSLVNQLMDFRKVESDNMKINMSSGDIISSISDIIIPFQTYATERGVQIRTIYGISQLNILFDEEAIRKLLTNLLSNALKYTPDNGTITLYVDQIYDKTSNTEKLYICVQDSGPGIKSEDLEHIFNKFYQAKDHSKYPVYGQSGTGIGLYLCKNIVSLLSGEIQAKNNRRKGASFRIVIPIRQEITEIKPLDTNTETNYTPDSSHEEEISENKIIKQNINILVVEDNSDMRSYICSILSDYYKTFEASNGAEALDILHAQDIDFIISDLMMPVMDGFELSQKVKSDFSLSHIPFLMLTAKSSIETQINSYKIGVDEFLAKPFNEYLLLTRIENILEARKTYQRRFSINMDISDLNISEETEDEKFLRRAMEIVQKNYKNPDYEVRDFIKEIGISKSLISKKMQSIAGQSVCNFIRNYRLSVAHELIIKNQNLNISEIAYEVGFNDPKYFTRCFSKHFGIPPSALNKKP